MAVVGFVLMPVTLLWYAFVITSLSGQWGIWAWIGLIIAVGVDLGTLISARDYYKHRFG